jgi:hypothetical protein
MIDTPKKRKHFYLPRHITENQSRDTGMAAVLICLLVAWFGNSQAWVGPAILLLIVNMVSPVIFRPAAFVWIGTANVLGSIMSKILLALIFFLLVTPVGLVRRAFGKDSLRLKQWKKDDASVFNVRDHQFQPEELEKPY